MTTVEQIDPEILEEYEQKQLEAKGMDQHEIYETLEQVDDNPYRMGEDAVAVSEAIEDALRTYLAVNDQVQSGEVMDTYDLNGDPEERDKFITNYAMFASCQKALYELDVPTGEGSLQTGIGDLITMDPDG
ncbi:MAG: hypothetical protein SVU32_05555, partial [Candidatus Nanohaloarchaea archaeon]|nr:hypothetical protein [Candidatus Nanohaloarchaea archaeon]